ncbi:MAG: DUF3795 domain-containing protein [Prolixibacteraceae bacterium]|nr:DUF3795 domain-containing protein [Prolixibacteraceae bacterium]
MKKEIVAPCGIGCFNCELYYENVTTDMQARISQLTKIPAEKIVCNGCAGGDLCLFLKLQGKSCKTLDCVTRKGVNFCFECPDFPCDLLMPLANGADKYPHNLKIFNLCSIKKLGLEEWKRQSTSIKQKYFCNSFEIGKGGSDN